MLPRRILSLTRMVAVDGVRIVALAAAARPAAGREERAEVGPLAKVCLSKDYCPSLSQVSGYRRVLKRRCADKCKRSCGCLHMVMSVDIVFQQDRYAHHRA